jgi:multiple sugar transport system permease protein
MATLTESRPIASGRRPPGGGARARRRREAVAAYGFLAPDVLGLLVFVAFPMVLALGVALFEVDGFGGYTFVGLENFKSMADDPMLLKSVQVTVVYVAMFVPLAFVVSLALALLVRDHFPGVGFVRAAFFVPNVISLVVTGLLWQFLLSDKQGIVPRLLRPLGLGDVSWLGTPSLALPVLVLISVWFLMGNQMLIFLAALKDIPREYEDAARVDGATPWQRFRHVTWPLLRPTSFFVLVTSLVNAVTGLQAFDLVYVVTKGGPANSTSTVVFYIYEQAFNEGHYGYAAAITTTAVAFLVIVTGVMFATTRGGRFHAE